MTSPGRVAYSASQIGVDLTISSAMFVEMQADPNNAADALAVAVINTLAFPVGFVRVAGTSPSLGAVGAFDLGRRLEDSPPSEAPLRMLSDPPNGSMVLSVTFEVLSETVTIDQTYASLDNLINNQIVDGQALQDTLVDQVKQYTQSMVLTCTVECAEVYRAVLMAQGVCGWLETSANFRRLVLGCIEAKICK